MYLRKLTVFDRLGRGLSLSQRRWWDFAKPYGTTVDGLNLLEMIITTTAQVNGHTIAKVFGP